MMNSMKNISPRAGDIVVTVGTAKGAFLFCSDQARDVFTMSGPHFLGLSTSAAAFVDGTKPRILLGVKSEHWGATVSWSDDFGATWTEPAEGNIKFPRGSGGTLNSIWTLEAGTALGSDAVLAGVDPAALFRSDDRGETFCLNEPLFNHPDRPRWNPGFGGLCLHSIVVHPQNPKRMYTGISSAGLYRTDDGGETWSTCVNGLRVHPDVPGATLCPHKLRIDAENPSCLYLQSHPGTYRSDDEGRSWISIETGLPSEFGFPMVAHPIRGGTIWTFPLTADAFRVPPNGQPKVWRSRDGGVSWEPLSTGLPQSDGYFTVLREAFCADSLDPAGLYFGTRGGQVYASNDEGDSWRMLAEFLPPVLCVKSAVIQ